MEKDYNCMRGITSAKRARAAPPERFTPIIYREGSRSAFVTL